MILIGDLQLRVVQEAHKEALARSKDQLEAALGVAIPKGWPHFPRALVPSDPDVIKPGFPSADWPGYFFIYSPERALVGSGGFKGPPDADGYVEIGYEIAAEHEGRGRATAAVSALLSVAFKHAAVRTVQAHTLGEENASNRVLKKVGMVFVQEVVHPEVGALWQWRISSAQYQVRQRG